MKWDNVHFTRVDADIAENLIDKKEDNTSVLSKDEEEKLKKADFIIHNNETELVVPQVLKLHEQWGG